MRLAESSIARLTHFVAQGDGEGLRRYLVACLPAGAPLDPVREALGTLTPKFRDLALDVAPWLADDRLGPIDATARLLDRFRLAGRDGVTLGDLNPGEGRDQALEALIASGQVIRERKRTGGRPADVFRLAEFAEGIMPADHRDPFAFKPARLID